MASDLIHVCMSAKDYCSYCHEIPASLSWQNYQTLYCCEAKCTQLCAVLYLGTVILQLYRLDQHNHLVVKAWKKLQ